MKNILKKRGDKYDKLNPTQFMVKLKEVRETW